MATNRWYDGLTFAGVQAAIRLNTAPRTVPGVIEVPRGFLAWYGKQLGIFEQQQEVESAAGEAGAEQPVDLPSGETAAGDGGVGAPAPLPDAGGEKVSEVKGVDGADEAEAKALLRLLRHLDSAKAAPIINAMDAGADCWQDLLVAVEAAIECGATRGQLTVDREGWRAYARWDKGKLDVATLETYDHARP